MFIHEITMTDVNQIQLFVISGESALESGERVYLGFNGRHGREFRCRLIGNNNANPFEPNQERQLIFGQDSNVLDSQLNDPRNPQMDDLMMGRAYIRIDTASQMEWIINDARVLINSSVTHNLVLTNTILHRDGTQLVYMD